MVCAKLHNFCIDEGVGGEPPPRRRSDVQPGDALTVAPNLEHGLVTRQNGLQRSKRQEVTDYLEAHGKARPVPRFRRQRAQ